MVDKLKLYVYPNAAKHVHDSIDKYVGFVPLSEQGIAEHCEVTTAEEADFFYMGQLDSWDTERYSIINSTHFEYFEKYPEKHIVDFEGEGGQEIPDWLHSSIITTMGPLKKYKDIKYLFTRPTFSHLFADLISGEKIDEIEDFKYKAFYFKGFINHPIRQILVSLGNIGKDNPKWPVIVETNSKWSGPVEEGDSIRSQYIQNLKDFQFSLCPRGSGIDSVRVLESCYYGRPPVIISDKDYMLVGEEQYSPDNFSYKIISFDPQEILGELVRLFSISEEEYAEKSRNAREYFDTVIRNYFSDPTKIFLNWLYEKQNI